MEGGHHNPHAVDEAVVDHEHEQHHDGGVQFSDSFGGGGVEHQPIAHTEAEPHHDDGGMMRRERKSSKDYSHTDEWGKPLSLLQSFISVPSRKQAILPGVRL